MLLVMIVGTVALKGRPPTKLHISGLVFRSSSTLLRVLILYILWPLIIGILITPMWWSDIIKNHSTWPITAFFAAMYFALFDLLPLSLIALFMATLPGPQELRLDKERHTYWLRFGTFLKPQIRSGTWEDIRGLFVRPIHGKGGTTISYGIYIAWAHGLSGGPPLGLFNRQDGAERQAERLSSEIGLRVVRQLK